MIATTLGFLITFAEYRKSNRIKRSEFLEKLITEFNEEKTYAAKKLLDDFWFDDTLQNHHELKEMSAKEFIERGSGKKKIGLSRHLKIVLRDHKDSPEQTEGISPVEQVVRESFDQLLDFFTKLDYYLSLKLISKKELSYFEYYINCCNEKAEGGVMIYAKAYGYMSLFRLLYVMNLDKKYTEIIPKKSDFISDAQDLYYHDLRNDIPIL